MDADSPAVTKPTLFNTPEADAVLADAPRGTPHHEVLVNLGGPVPAGFERFERLNEVVTQGEQIYVLA